MFHELRSASQGPALVLTLHAPAHRNALAPAICTAGIEAINAAETNADIHCVVITGTGSLFSDAGLAPHATAEQLSAHTDSLRSFVDTIRTSRKPVIAAVEGAATGPAFALALACDLVVAARDAVFAIASAQAALAGGATWSLAHALPRQLASDLLMTGAAVGAERLHALGLVNRLSLPGGALDTALALSQELRRQPAGCVAAAKELLAEAPGRTFAAQLQEEHARLLKIKALSGLPQP